MSERVLSDIRSANERIVRLLQTINTNILALHEQALNNIKELKKVTNELTKDVDLDKLVEDSRKIAEAGKNFETIVEDTPSIPQKKWWVGQRVVVSEPALALVGYVGEVVSIIANDSIAVLLDGCGLDVKHFHVNHISPIETRSSGFVYHTNEHAIDIGSQTVPPFTWVKLGEETLEDANQLSLPAIVQPHKADKLGQLFPWQWRENLGWDKIPEEIRQQRRTHENHPMTEEAFRIYNAGLVSEFVVKTKQEEK